MVVLAQKINLSSLGCLNIRYVVDDFLLKQYKIFYLMAEKEFNTIR